MGQKQVDQSYYEILEISPEAPEHEIQRAYQQAKKTYSPDSPALYTMFTPEEAKDLAKLIDEAYAVLSNNISRKEYDQKLLGRGENEHPQLTREPQEVPLPKTIPDGYARTRYSVYEINPDFEKQIESREEFEGTFLNKIRSYKQVNLETLSRDIRVSRSYLMAIEKNDFEALPASVFVRGFVVQYAKALGLDPDHVASSYMKFMKNGQP